ncbi:MAG TPA: TlpA disulfide reductase family protein [Bacteroidales bacterium]|nr:TlpA disulfide reductase family protein [Bacteroidales bacterium]HPT21639.1 TlpA disulfide reductase family protein [Bacteroidales bacterium]
MKKTYFVATSILALFLSVTLISSCKVETNKYDYLKKVLANLEKIKSATYSSTCIASAPGDTLAFRTLYSHTEEYNNPTDTIAGSSFTVTQQTGYSKVSWFYDGIAFTYLLWDENKIEIDSFKTNKLPVRPISTPFFNYTKSIIKYALETKDSISTELKDFGDSIKFSLYIPCKIIEFLGKPVVWDNPLLSSKDKFSKYDIWINKSDNLPYRYKRHMPHQTTWETCKNVEYDKIKIADFKVLKYFPSNFEIMVRGKQKTKKIDLTGKVATDWSLQNTNNETISLKDLKSKVLMIQFTGIGCGPCHASIPFLKQLVTDYKDKSFELISIETWSDNITGIKRYCTNNGLNYMFLMSTKDVTKSYQIQSVPSFYILDKNRVIRKIINGYSEKTTDKEIKDAINELI